MALAIVASLPVRSSAQSGQLMLADIMIALRSKKVSLQERNDIIAKAVAARGVNFGLTPEIEKALSDTGADKSLIEAIRAKTQLVKVAAVVPSATDAKPKQEPVAPPPPDFSFYEKRADAYLLKGDVEPAIADFSKAIEMNPKSFDSFLGRAAAYTAKQSNDEAIADYNKVIELKPDNVVAHVKLAQLIEKKGDVDGAFAEYNKALAIDAANETAKSATARITADKAKALEAAKAAAAAAAAPEFVDVGSLTKEQATSFVMPIYPPSAARANIVGRVVVEVTFDAEGKVLTAKANSGPTFLKSNAEAAALRSKFKPATWNGKPNKGKGYIAYNFTKQV